ncbi:MAG TPA: aminopeptidase P family N-terminal domain-containing protein [Thermotogota bacterium]|nr:aminopeptidase P family N-terminal domain-containing protein [Thermotogota bacterium]HPJ88787.1 aminopeptidase P family N-terminal domain-containing protein [Thermotogota bacterium]HPR96290.1 aminopeptidase P family N-terminal domain-containing protein [Thermotogota bacterium]
MKAIIRERIAKLREVMKKSGNEGILLSREENIAYLTFGARNHITFNTTEGVSSILITDEKTYLITNNIEMHRLFAEEIPEEIHDLFTKIEFNWWESEYEKVSGLVNIRNLLSDTGRYKTNDISADINAQRYILSRYEYDSLRALGKVIDEVFYERMPQLTPQMTEIEVQGLFFYEFLKRGFEPILVLVFGSESAQTYRHNLPRNVELKKSCFVSFCIRHRGLVISSTRSVQFEKNDRLIEQHLKNCRIDAKLIAASRPGVMMNRLFSVMAEAYAAEGFEDEWRLHHQGGLAGYKSRELVCNPSLKYTIQTGNCVAWNPTLTGTKSEDTAIIHADTNEIVSCPENSQWPVLTFEIDGMTVRRPDIVAL